MHCIVRLVEQQRWYKGAFMAPSFVRCVCMDYMPHVCAGECLDLCAAVLHSSFLGSFFCHSCCAHCHQLVNVCLPSTILPALYLRSSECFIAC